MRFLHGFTVLITRYFCYNEGWLLTYGKKPKEGCTVMKNKAVILGSNYYIALSVMRCLAPYGVTTVAAEYSKNGAYALKSKHCKEVLMVPHYKKETKAFIKALIDYAKEQEAKPVLFPCADQYVEVIDENFDELKEHYLISQTEKGIYTKAMDKDSLYQIAEAYGMKVPETARITDDDFYEKIENVIKYPCIIKPADSPAFVAKFRRKIFKVHSRKELDEALAKVKDAKLEVVVQRIIPGFDDHMHTFDAYIDQNNKVTHWLTCQKLRQFPINFGASVFTQQKNVPELYEIGAPFLEYLTFKGFAEIEFKKDEVTGDFYLIEINVRYSNLNTMVAKAGLNMPYITYRELTGDPLPPKTVEETTGITFVYGYEDFLAVREYIKTKQLTLGHVIKTWFGRPKAYAIWSWSDPKPGLMVYAGVFKKIARKIFRIKKK
jgi:predicted ATP-grasp superfamily ATP-dependent carboligase